MCILESSLDSASDVLCRMHSGKSKKRLTKEGITEPIHFADWVAPKKDGTSLQVCRYLKITINQVSKLDKYPVPNIDDLLAQELARGKRFMKLNMPRIPEVVLEEDSQKYVVTKSHRGLFCYNQLLFVILSSLGIFQRVMESLLSGGRMRETGLWLRKDK